MSLLKVRNIETYYGPVMAIKGVSFDVPEGAIVTILGANGAGKTTILKTISGVMDPKKGTIEFLDQRIDSLPPNKIVRMGISQVPEGREVFHDLTVRENLLMGAYLRRDREGIKEDLEIACEYFPVLERRSSQLAGELSGGEQQMVVIARALMARPKLLLLDEPSLGLSPLMVKEIYGIIQRINREQGMTILLIEQNAPMALSVASHGFVLELGRIVMDDTCQALLANEDVQEFYLGIKEEGVRGTRRWKRKKKWR
jgi:branched-chain amino acid transport system ATP-binding protein